MSSAVAPAKPTARPAGRRGLTLARGLQLPIEATTAAAAIVGQRGSGKTSTAVVGVEEAIAAGAHVAVWDPTGAWYGLRANAAGDRAGLPVVVLGGHHGDAPLEEGAGELVVELIVDEGYNVVLDLELLSKGAQARLGADFFEALYGRNRDALLLVVDEAHRPAPQQLRDMGGHAARCLGALIDCVTLGRRKGIGVWVVTQRTSRLHKDILEGCEIMLAHRLMGPNDRKAIAGWLADAAQSDADASRVLSELGTLANGEIIAYAPTFGIAPKRFKVRRKRTFDSSATPTVGVRVRPAPAVRAAIDLEALGQRMADTIARHEQGDPTRLRQRIAALERQLAEIRAASQHRAVKQLQAVGQCAETLEQHVQTALGAITDLAVEVGDVRILANGDGPPADRMASAASRSLLGGGDPKGAGALQSPAASAPRSQDGPHGAAAGSDVSSARAVQREEKTLKAGARRMLYVLWRFDRPLTRNQLATLAVVARGGTLSEYLSALRTSGLIAEESGTVTLSSVGRSEAQRTCAGSREPYTPEEIAALHHPKLKAGARRMLDVLMRAPEQGFTRTELAGLASVSMGGTLSEYLSALRTRGLIDEHHRRVYAGSVLYLARNANRSAASS